MGLAIALTAYASNRDKGDSPVSKTETNYSSELIRDGAIHNRYPPQPTARQRSAISHTPIRADETGTAEALRQYLQSKGSPLAPFTDRLLESEYWSTIIGICTIEQYSCSRLPGGDNWNLWGLMRAGGGLQRFETAAGGIQAIDSFLSKAESRGRTTIESFRGWYCVNRNYPGNVCPNWEPTVLKVKNELEAL